jgi:hypothetical protein
MEELSVLYVAMTRARSFLDIVLRDAAKVPVASLLHAALLPVGGDGVTESFAATAACPPAAEQGAHHATTTQRDPGMAGGLPAEDEPLLSAFGRTVHVTPSGAGHSGNVSIARILSSTNRAAMRRGEIIHSWLREVSYIEDGLPDAGDWVSAATEADRDIDRREVARWASGLLEDACRTGSELHRALSLPVTAAGESVELWRERRFVVTREAGGRNEVMNGSFDRVVIRRDPAGRAIQAGIVDFKTDGFGSREEREALVERYRPQLESYRAALGILLPSLRPEDITASLVFVAG